MAESMRDAARAFLSALKPDQRGRAQLRLNDPARLQWDYRPKARPGTCLLGLDEHARKAAHRLLATALSRSAFAQAVTIMGWEEVLDRDEDGARGRHSDDYWVVLAGDPDDEAWTWRFEGHHLSVTATLADDEVVIGPLFFGANPSRVHAPDGGQVLAPLAREEDLARALITDLPPDLHRQAVLSATAPDDIISQTDRHLTEPLCPLGIPGRALDDGPKARLASLLSVYLDRFTPDQRIQVDPSEAWFAWAGGTRPGEGHYYRLQTEHLLVEYDNTQREADHAHTVIRQPGQDFGAHLLPAHRADHP
ncbi:DUF3500 domain-containing protein [Spirillospora sp. CA-294931]|uniref:DUF3500 domain-containing protein n=1 Tax=Spirillospora sp. CA-294931 TaxID=3240042 RepID=UPI003D93082D